MVKIPFKPNLINFGDSSIVANARFKLLELKNGWSAIFQLVWSIDINYWSINVTQHVGSTIQDDLFEIIARFRTLKFVLTADIEKIYAS